MLLVCWFACCWYAAVNKEGLKQERGEHPNLETMITMATMTKTQSSAPQTIMTQAHRGPVLDYPTNGAEMNVSSVCCQQNTQGLAESNFWILVTIF